MQPRENQPGASLPIAVINRTHRYHYDVQGCNFGGTAVYADQMHVPDYKIWTLKAGSPDKAGLTHDSGIYKWPPVGGLTQIPKVGGYGPPEGSIRSQSVAHTHEEFDEDRFLEEGLNEMDM